MSVSKNLSGTIETSSNSAGGEVILISPPKQCSPAKKWAFTVFNLEQDNIDNIVHVLKSSNNRYIMGRETCPETGRKHIQGYVEFVNKCRPKGKFNDNTIHWEKAKGDRESNLSYCSKEDPNPIINGFFLPKKIIKLEKCHLNEAQKYIVAIFDKPEDPLFGRKVYWFYEDKGNWGKSITCKYMIDHMDAVCLSGACADCLFGISEVIKNRGDCPPIIIFDIPRTNKNGISYQAIEALKNGFFFNTKYESGMCRFNSPHVVVFSNEKPEFNKLSKDRWRIAKLKTGIPEGEPLKPVILPYSISQEYVSSDSDEEIHNAMFT